MKKLVLLTGLTTEREDDDGNATRVRFPAGKVAELTGDEIEMLDKLTISTGRPQYRTPVNESAEAGDPAVVVPVDEFDGETVPMADKTVAQLKAYLDHNEVEYDADAKKPALLTAAETHEADGGL